MNPQKRLTYVLTGIVIGLSAGLSAQFAEVVVGGTRRCPIPEYTDIPQHGPALQLIDALLEELGLFRNFQVVECRGMDNALAQIVEVHPGVAHRFIFYDPSFLDRIAGGRADQWSSLAVLAHEIAHHLNGHTLGYRRGKYREELEADYSSGHWLATLGATLEQAQSAVSAIPYDYPTITHPARADRLEAIQKGWNQSRGIASPPPPRSAEAWELFEAAEDAFTRHEYREAYQLFEDARTTGLNESLYFLSHLHYTGLGAPKDLEKARALAQLGFRKGSVPCVYQFGKYLALGTGGQQVDSVEARRLFEKDFQYRWFAERYRKRRIPHYAYVMGFMLQSGYGGVDPNPKEALYWFRTAAREGELSALMNLGVMLDEGNLVEDMEEAVGWFRKAAEAGEPSAMYRLGSFYSRGLGVSRDSRRALFWFEQAARQGSPRAMYALGVMYDRGMGSERNEQKAFRWLRDSAAQGSVPGMYYLASYYQYGKAGIRADRQKARFWYQKAAENGHPAARAKIAELGF